MNIEASFYEDIFKSVTKEAITSRINKGNKAFLEQSVSDFSVKIGDGNSLISAFVFDSKRKSVYKTSFKIYHFDKDFINRFNLDSLDVRKDKSLTVLDLYNFDEFYSAKLVEISKNNLENFIYDIQCDCHEVKKKDYCFHYYTVLVALFTKIEFDLNFLWNIRGINKGFNCNDYKFPIITPNSIDNDTEQLFYGRKLPADLLKKIKKKDSKKLVIKDYQYSGFKESFTTNKDLLKSLFLEWLKKSY